MKKTTKMTLFTSVILLLGCAQESNIHNNKQKTAGETEQAETTLIATSGLKEPSQIRQAIVVTSDEQPPTTHTRVKAYSIGEMESIRSINNRQRTKIMRPNMPYLTHTLQNSEQYDHYDSNGIFIVTEQPVSTFSIDVDTASYSNIRRILNQGKMPRHDAVRVEELINYFNYQYPKATNGPFSISTEVGPSPYNADKYLLHIGVQGKVIPQADRPPANLVFLLDVSGSMKQVNKLGLLKNGLKMLTKQLTAKDSVAIVVYAGAAGTVLKPTSGDNKTAIIDALMQLSAGGSTNGEAGIEGAYRLAQKAFKKDGINRIILATDGDFNLGTVNRNALTNLIENKRKSGIELSILGFGSGNYNDDLMQKLAQQGNGNAYYIDTLHEARKVLVEELSSTLFTIAKDVKIQVEFNPTLVSEYRLIGYESRALKRSEFNNDKVDAGEIGAGHSVTALYEISFIDSKNKAHDALRFQPTSKSITTEQHTDELAFLRLRYKPANTEVSQLIKQPINKSATKLTMESSSDNFQFSAAVAGFAQVLRGGENLSTMAYNDIIDLAQRSKGDDKHGYRAEFINIVKLAQALAPLIDNQANMLVRHK